MFVIATIVSALRAPAIFAATVSALILYVLPSAPIPMEEMTGIYPLLITSSIILVSIVSIEPT